MIDESPSSSVAVVVGGTWHAPQMAEQLSSYGMLHKVFTTTPPARFRTRGAVPVESISWLPLPEVFGGRGLEKVFRRSAALSTLKRTSFELLVRRQIVRRNVPSMAVVFATFGRNLLPFLSQHQVRTVLERGSTHARHRLEVLSEEFHSVGMSRTVHEMKRDLSREEDEYELADSISVPSEFAASTFVDRGIDRHRLNVIPYGVDVCKFVPLPRRPHRELSVLTVGNLGVEKGTRYLIDGLHRLHFPVRLTLVGTLEPWLHEHLRALPDHVRVELVGPTSQTELVRYYQEADIFCLPSLQEGMSMAVLEGMACGAVPVVTAECGHGSTVRHGRTGLTVRTRDSTAITDAIAALADKDVRGAMAEAAVDVAQRSTWVRYGRALTKMVTHRIG